jgi:hypothetical protein
MDKVPQRDPTSQRDILFNTQRGIWREDRGMADGLRNDVKSHILYISIGGYFGKVMRLIQLYNPILKSPSSTKAVHILFYRNKLR